MKPGDMVWVRVEYRGDDEYGEFYHQPVAAWIAPDHPALPAVARWLAEHGDSVTAEFKLIDGWLDYLVAAADDDATVSVVDRMVLSDGVIPALRALLTALTEVES